MSTDEPSTNAPVTVPRREKRSAFSILNGLTIKRKILVAVLIWGMIETIVNWIFKANGIEVGPSSLPPILSIILGGW